MLLGLELRCITTWLMLLCVSTPGKLKNCLHDRSGISLDFDLYSSVEHWTSCLTAVVYQYRSKHIDSLDFDLYSSVEHWTCKPSVAASIDSHRDQAIFIFPGVETLCKGSESIISAKNR